MITLKRIHAINRYFQNYSYIFKILEAAIHFFFNFIIRKLLKKKNIYFTLNDSYGRDLC